MRGRGAGAQARMVARSSHRSSGRPSASPILRLRGVWHLTAPRRTKPSRGSALVVLAEGASRSRHAIGRPGPGSAQRRWMSSRWSLASTASRPAACSSARSARQNQSADRKRVATAWTSSPLSNFGREHQLAAGDPQPVEHSGRSGRWASAMMGLSSVCSGPTRILFRLHGFLAGTALRRGEGRMFERQRICFRGGGCPGKLRHEAGARGRVLRSA